MPAQSPFAIYPAPLVLPWWHNRWDRWRGKKRPIVHSGCATVAGRVQCDPEDMRARAEQKLKALGVWQGYLPLTTYTLARVIASEVGGGSPEEKVAVGEAYGINAPRVKGKRDVNDVLLYQPGPGHGAYGPIHGPGMDAPFGRYAATSADPGVDDLLIADFVLKGRSQNFSRGADDQDGPEIEGDAHHPVGWVYNKIDRPCFTTSAGKRVCGYAQQHKYWVGPLPGVDHWNTFLFATRKDVDRESPLGQALIVAARAALAERPGATSDAWVAHQLFRRDWSQLAVASPPPEAPTRVFAASRPRVAAASVAGIAAFLALSAGVGLWTATRAEKGKLFLWY